MLSAISGTSTPNGLRSRGALSGRRIHSVGSDDEIQADEYRGKILEDIDGYKTGLNRATFVENQLAIISQGYIHGNQKQDQTPGLKLNNSKQDIKVMLNSTNRDIQLALYKLSRVVDTGNFHKVLDN